MITQAAKMAAEHQQQHQEEEYNNPWPDDPMAALIARSLASAKPLAKKGDADSKAEPDAAKR